MPCLSGKTLVNVTNLCRIPKAIVQHHTGRSTQGLARTMITLHTEISLSTQAYSKKCVEPWCRPCKLRRTVTYIARWCGQLAQIAFGLLIASRDAQQVTKGDSKRGLIAKLQQQTEGWGMRNTRRKQQMLSSGNDFPCLVCVCVAVMFCTHTPKISLSKTSHACLRLMKTTYSRLSTDDTPLVCKPGHTQVPAVGRLSVGKGKGHHQGGAFPVCVPLDDGGVPRSCHHSYRTELRALSDVGTPVQGWCWVIGSGVVFTLRQGMSSLSDAGTPC